MKGTTRYWLVAGLGAMVTGVGMILPRGRLKTAALSFGMTQVALGLSGMLKPEVRQ
jgi:hypothetical protein